MRLFIYKIRDKLRTMAGIRVERQVPPASSEKPPIGSSIVREKLRMRLKYPIPDDLWKFFIAMGWRTVDMRLNKRRYTVVPDKVLLRFIKSNEIERHVLHARLVKPDRRSSDSHQGHADTDAPFVKTSKRKFEIEKSMAE